jgi:hypothetical protein
LANQEDKLAAMEAGMMQSMFRIYDLAMSAGGGAARGNKTSNTLALPQQQQQQQPQNQQQEQDTVQLRQVLVQVVRSFVLLARGRQLLHKSIGLSRTLKLLADPAAEVRVAACALLGALASFPDSRKPCQEGDGAMQAALVHTFLKDSSEVVVHACLAPLQQLTNWNPLLDGPTTLAKLAKCIAQQAAEVVSPATKRTGPPLERLNTALQVVWNSALLSGQKELAIDAGVVEAVVPLLQDAHAGETMRLASGLLAALAVAQSGKQRLIAQPGAVAQACKLTLDRRAAAASALGKAVRDNAVALVRNFSEANAGLHAVGAALVLEPEALLAVLGADRTAQVLARRLAAAAASVPSSPAGEEDYIDEAPAVASSPLTSPDEVLCTLRALLALLKTGAPESSSAAAAAEQAEEEEPDDGNDDEAEVLPPTATSVQGREAAWRVLDIVPQLHRLTHYRAPPSSSQQQQQQSATAADAAATVPKLASRALLLLATDEPEARSQLRAIGALLGSARVAQEEIFALVDASAARQAAALDALRAKRAERLERRRAAERALREAEELEGRERARLEQVRRAAEEEAEAAERAAAAAEAGAGAEAGADGAVQAQA